MSKTVEELKVEVVTSCPASNSGNHEWVDTLVSSGLVYDSYQTKVRNFIVPQCLWCNRYDDAKKKELFGGRIPDDKPAK